LPAACVIFNPTAQGDRARRLGHKLGQSRAHLVLRPTPGPGTARSIAANAIQEGFKLLIAAGGDGTVNEVINGIADIPGGFERTALSIVPMGTANVLARELGIGRGFAAITQPLDPTRTRSLDLVHVTYVCRGEQTTRWMAQLAGAGLDARAVELVDWRMKKRCGYLAYVVAGLRALRETQPQMTLSDGSSQRSGRLVLLGNGRLYGGPFPMWPEARLDDGLLDVRLFPTAGLRTALGCGWAALTRRFHRVGGSRTFQVQQLELTSTSRTPLEIDGEPAGELPARFEVVPRCLRLLLP